MGKVVKIKRTSTPTDENGQGTCPIGWAIYAGVILKKNGFDTEAIESDDRCSAVLRVFDFPRGKDPEELVAELLDDYYCVLLRNNVSIEIVI